MCSGSLLELACGSGRLLLPLAREGHTLTGVDTSERMLALAQARLQEEHLSSRLTLVQQDMCTLRLPQKYNLAFIALCSFAHLTTPKPQQQALAAVRAPLTKGGTFLVHIPNTDPR